MQKLSTNYSIRNYLAGDLLFVINNSSSDKFESRFV